MPPRRSLGTSAPLAQRESPSLPPHLPRDILAFLHHYPDTRSDPTARANLDFYRNQGPARPRSASCSELQSQLRGNWHELEQRHDFIQWFFPIREQGVNWAAQPLLAHEIDELRKDKEAMSRLLESYRILLEFYGLRLVDPQTGQLALVDDVPVSSPAHFRARFANLERNGHNFLRITRILKCLGEFGLSHHAASFLLYLLYLQSRSSIPLGGPFLVSPQLVRSMDGYWRYCLRDDQDRQFVLEKCDEVRKGGEWTQQEYCGWVERRAAERAGEGPSTE